MIHPAVMRTRGPVVIMEKGPPYVLFYYVKKQASTRCGGAPL
jgi:hypothetical protein